MNYPSPDEPLPIPDETERELVLYLARSGLTASPKIRQWWAGLPPDQRRRLLEQTFTSAD